MPRRIDKTECAGCGICQRVCIIGCITEDEDGKSKIVESGCVDCGACQNSCPFGCITHQSNLLQNWQKKGLETVSFFDLITRDAFNIRSIASMIHGLQI